MGHKFLFSVIMPIYNVEKYLEEAVDSIIEQTLGFEENVQIVMINDGSPDNSEEICLQYKNKYPDNIVYKKIPNGGVSNARNTAFEYVDAKYITFLDPDDKWGLDAFENAYSFLEEHENEIDVLAARIQFFEANDNFHALDYKFDRGTRVAHLDNEEELFSVQSTAATTFIRCEALGDIRFDKRLKFGEDSTFINKIMLKKKAYGLTVDSMYYYRRRQNGDSAVNNQVLDKSFYTDSIEFYHLELMRYCEEMYGEIIPYVQSMVAYDLYWRIDTEYYLDILTPEEQELYMSRVKTILSRIDDKILLKNPKHKTLRKKSVAFKLKYDRELFDEFVFNPEDSKIYYKDIPISNIPKSNSRTCKIAYVDIVGNTLKVDVFIAKWLFKCKSQGEVKLSVEFGSQVQEPEILDHDPYNVAKDQGKESYYYRCHCEFDLSNVGEGETRFKTLISFGEHKTPIAMAYNKFIPSCKKFPPAYKIYGRYVVRCYKNSIRISKPKDIEATSKKLEADCIQWLKDNELQELAEIRENLPKFKAEQKKKGSIWLFSDRIDNAGDSGEVVFTYISKHTPKGVQPIFTIGENASPKVIERLKSVGTVVFFEDPMFKYYFLAADRIISSSAGEFTIDAFEEDRPYVTDLYNFDFYFMNHGVNCGDCSGWLNRFNKNIRIFFNTGVNERQAIIDGRYYYTEDQCVITGLPRFDALYDAPKKQLLVLPSWRKSIKGAYDAKTSSVYFDKFNETEYFKFYNGLINDERLLAKMREKGYKGLFCLHPIFMKQSVDFQGNDVFDINEGFIDYNKVFAESSVMVTDYSTIAFDFAYLKKPMVYTQFDKEEFYKTQTYDQGFFEYERDGFGPVCYDLDSAVEELIKIIDNDCKNEYIKRVTDFFVNLDKNNSKRVVDAVLNDSKKQAKQNKKMYKLQSRRRLFR